MQKLNLNDVITNDQLCEIFGCSGQGGMRRSHKTNTLVIVSDHLKSIYEDRWVDGVLHYTGMGQEGDQSIDENQNRTLAQSNTSRVAVHLFEKFGANNYCYRGEVKLIAEPYIERQPDKYKNDRDVWIFPVQPLSGQTPPLTTDQAEALYKAKDKKAKTLSDEEVKKRALRAKGKINSRQSSSNQYDRDPWVSEYAKRRANGICQLCELPAPFKNKEGIPYLETHHITWLSKGGDDTVKNTVALCPNCHRKMHILNASADVAKLRAKAKQ